MKLKLLLGAGCVCLLAVFAVWLVCRPGVEKQTANGRNLLEQSKQQLSAAQYKAAERSARKAVKLFRGLAREYPRRNDFPQHLGHSQWVLSDALAATGRQDEAEQVANDALQVFAKAAVKFPNVPFMRQEEAFTQRKIGTLMESAGRFDEAERRFRLAGEIYAGIKQKFPNNSWYAREEAYSIWMAAGFSQRAGHPDEAEEQYREAIRLHEQAIRCFPNDRVFKDRLQTIQNNLANLLRTEGKTSETSQSASRAD